jgi:hypothetical protein
MADNTIQAGTNQPDPVDDTDCNPKGVATGIAAIASWTPITTRGQKYVGAAGRHSQQTHRRAHDRAAVGGHGSEKELHAHDRSLLETELKRRADLRLQQQQSSSKK